MTVHLNIAKQAAERWRARAEERASKEAALKARRITDIETPDRISEMPGTSDNGRLRVANAAPTSNGCCVRCGHAFAETHISTGREDIGPFAGEQPSGESIVAPTVFGYTEQARLVKRSVTVGAAGRRRWDKDQFFADAAARLSDLGGGRDHEYSMHRLRLGVS